MTYSFPALLALEQYVFVIIFITYGLYSRKLLTRVRLVLLTYIALHTYESYTLIELPNVKLED